MNRLDISHPKVAPRIANAITVIRTRMKALVWFCALSIAQSKTPTTPFLFSAACCQRSARAQLRGRDLGPVVRHSPFRERLADMLADSVRALLLESVGYRVDLIEFVPSWATPKNVLLRAEWIDRPRPEARAKADALTRHFGVRPALEAAL